MFNARVFKVDGVADAGAVANHQQIGCAQRDRADHHVAPDFCPQCAQPPGVERRAAEQIDRRRLDQAVGQPPAEVGHAPQRVAAGLEATDNQPLAGDGQRELKQCGHQKGGGRDGNRPHHRIVRVAGEVVIGKKRRQPLAHAQRDQARNGYRLRSAAAPAFERRRRRPAGGHWRCSGVRLRQHVGNAANAAVFVNIAHGDMRKAGVGAQGRGQPGRKQRMAAQVREKVGAAANRLARKELGQRGKQHFFGRRHWRVGFRCVQRPQRERARFQGIAVDLARGQAWHLGQHFKEAGHHVGG